MNQSMSKEKIHEKAERRYNEEGIWKALSAYKIAGKLLRCLYISRLKDPHRKENMARKDFIKQYPDAIEEDIALVLQWRRIEEERKKTHGLKVHYAMEEAKLERDWRDHIEVLPDMNSKFTQEKKIQRSQIKEVLKENTGKSVTVYFVVHWEKGKIGLYKQANLIIDKDWEFIVGKGTFLKEIIPSVSPIEPKDEMQPKIKKTSQWRTDNLIFSESNITGLAIDNIGYGIEEVI